MKLDQYRISAVTPSFNVGAEQHTIRSRLSCKRTLNPDNPLAHLTAVPTGHAHTLITMGSSSAAKTDDTQNAAAATILVANPTPFILMVLVAQ